LKLALFVHNHYMELRPEHGRPGDRKEVEGFWELRGTRGRGRVFKRTEVLMLVLSRKLNEKIVIDGGIVVTVVKIEGGQVRIGVEAPSHIKVFREEILGKSHMNRAGEGAVPTLV
jgi:carbon storage regulator